MNENDDLRNFYCKFISLPVLCETLVLLCTHRMNTHREYDLRNLTLSFQQYSSVFYLGRRGPIVLCCCFFNNTVRKHILSFLMALTSPEGKKHLQVQKEEITRLSPIAGRMPSASPHFRWRECKRKWVYVKRGTRRTSSSLEQVAAPDCAVSLFLETFRCRKRHI